MNKNNNPLISIITIVFNGKEFIEQTILSVLTQNYTNIEYIVIDGGSTDGTIDIIKKYQERIFYWISEPDDGIADAFNKGLLQAKGSIVGIINSDDYYEINAFQNVVDYYLTDECQKDQPFIIYGQTYKINISGEKLVKKANNLGWWISVPFSHCSSFVSNSYYTKYGFFNRKYKIAMDVDLLIRGLGSANYYEINYFLATQRDGGLSDKLRIIGYKEYKEIVKKQLGFFKPSLGYFLKILIFIKNKFI